MATLYLFKEKIENILHEGKGTELLSIVQSVRIYLQQEGENSLYQKFISSELLQLVLPFLNYKLNVFGDLIFETLQIIATLTSGNEQVIKALISEGYLRRITMAFMESTIYKKEFNTIVVSLSNMAVSSGDVIESLDRSGVLELITNEVYRYYGDLEVCENMIWFFSNLTVGSSKYPLKKVATYVDLMFNCINSVDKPTFIMTSKVIWGTAIFIGNQRDTEKTIEYLKNRGALKDILEYYQTDFPSELVYPYSRLLAHVTFHFEICQELVNQDICEVILFSQENDHELRKQRSNC